MATTKLVIESAVNLFLQHWNNGLCPSLSLKTQTNGNIDISVTLSISPISQPQEVYNSRPSSRRSSNGSRLRRKERCSTKTKAKIYNPPVDHEETIESCSFVNTAFEAAMTNTSDSALELELTQSILESDHSLNKIDMNDDQNVLESTIYPLNLRNVNDLNEESTAGSALIQDQSSFHFHRELSSLEGSRGI